MLDAPLKSPMLGWIKPDDNVRPDHDCYHIDRWLQKRGIEGVRTVVGTSVSSGVHEREELFEAGDLHKLIPPAKELADAGCDVIVWACTSGSFIGGLDWCRAQSSTLAEAIGRPATSTTLAIIAAIQHLGADTVDLLGTYPKPVTMVLNNLLEDADIQVDHAIALDAPEGKASFQLDLCREVKRLGGPSFGRSNPVIIPDTAANSLNLLTDLEAILQRPVVTAVQATLWYGLILLGVEPVAHDAGILFSGERWRASAS